MEIKFVDLKAQYYSIKEEVDEAIQSILENTSFIGGPILEEFKNNFQEVVGVKHCIPCANGTDALYISMRMMGIGPGDEVITTASSWISTSESITQTGATPVFVDIDEFNTIDVTKIEAKITSATKAIIPVHLYGQMCDMPAIMQIAKKHGIKVLEDCAQSHLSAVDGKVAGLWGDIATFSFYPGKNLGAYGDAGCMVTNDDQLAEECKKFANHGSLVKHQHEIEGINSRMDTLQAAILNVKLPRLIEWTDARIRVAKKYTELLASVEDITVPKVRPNSKHSFHVYGIKSPKRDELKEFLKNKGVPTQIHYPKAMPFMKAYNRFGFQQSDFPNAHDLQETELSLPIYPEITDAEIAYIVDSLSQFKG
ncbi:MAG: DegT/DnrJ/EryC1/StrS family aminotransferase [Cytophagales bacterium]|nr:DegT/DnrJ/EryC1/StrS family aminotransferase [Cytophagales bacterium]